MIRTTRALAVSLLGLVLLLPTPAQAAVQVLDRIVAVVNNGVIMNSELDQRVEQIQSQFQADGRPVPPIPVLRKQILERMVTTRIQLQLANRMGIRVNDSELNQVLTGLAKQNGIDSLQDFAEAIRSDGESWSDFRQHVRDKVIVSELQQREVTPRVRVTDREVKQFMESEQGRQMLRADFHLAQILIKVPGDASPQQVEKAESEANKLVRELHNGADFKKLAVAHSDGPDALEGGDLGWRPAAEWPTLFADTAMSMEKGDISSPLRSGAGFHILKMVDRRGGSAKVITQYKVRHVLIKPDDETTDEQAQAEADKLHDEVASGKLSMATAASEHSDDPASASHGGQLGWVTPGQMVPRFEQVMENTRPGTLSPVFQTRFGYHFLTVEDKRQANTGKLQARNALGKRHYDQALETWLQKQRAEAYVDIRLQGDDGADAGT